MLIALYGINNIGKTTQIKLLQKKLKEIGQTVKILKYPIYHLKPTGPKINQLLRDPNAQIISGKAFQMLYIQNRLDYQPSLLKDLKKYDVVLTEDYIGTGIAWGMTQGVSYPWLQKTNKKYHQKKADLEILLDGERFLTGKENGHRNENNDQAIQQTRKNLLFLAHKHNWPIIKANQSVKKTTEGLWVVISKKLILRYLL